MAYNVRLLAVSSEALFLKVRLYKKICFKDKVYCNRTIYYLFM